MNEVIDAHEIKRNSKPDGFDVADIYFIFFRHWKKIFFFSLLGIGAAAPYYFLTPKIYQSQAKLLIRYVMETKSVNPELANDAQIKTPDRGGQNILNSEIEVLTSFDLAVEVAEVIGPERILAKIGGQISLQRAAGVVYGGISVNVPRGSSVLRIKLAHPDREMAREILAELINKYKAKHLEIHREFTILQDLAQRADVLRSKLAQTEEELQNLKKSLGIISMEESKREILSQMLNIRQKLLDTEAQLFERQAALSYLNPSGASLELLSTNGPAIPREKMDEYRNVRSELESLKQLERNYLRSFNQDYPMVQRIRQQIGVNQNLVSQLEKEFPSLTDPAIASPINETSIADRSGILMQIRGLEAKTNILSIQLREFQTNLNALILSEPTLVRLQRQKETEETNYRYYQSTLEQKRLEESFGPGKITNISVVQSASGAAPLTGKTMKIVGGLLAGGIGLGLGLAFLLEKFLDRSVKRSSELPNSNLSPHFLDIPKLRLKRRKANPKLLANGQAKKLNNDNTFESTEAESATASIPLPPSYATGNEELVLHSEALRDRLVTYFELRNMTHKPKLVAVSSCNHGAGTSTIAAGLAASLSETGDGNVLLVDMNNTLGGAHPFFRGKPGCGLNDLLESPNHEDAQVHQNLYMVSEDGNNGSLSRILPKRFHQLVPRLKASDFDYIIFDMPPVSQTSVTPRVARFMDMTLLVVESEKTPKDMVQQAQALLAETKANVGTILNKTKTYIPRWLHREL